MNTKFDTGLPKQKTDMSPLCMKQFNNMNPNEAMWIKLRDNEISQEQFDEWFDSHCGLCTFMHEICMYGEE